MIKRAKISAVRANSFVVVEQFIVFFLVIRNSSNKRRIGGAALINFFVPDAALIRVNTVGHRPRLRVKHHRSCLSRLSYIETTKFTMFSECARLFAKKYGHSQLLSRVLRTV